MMKLMLNFCQSKLDVHHLSHIKKRIAEFLRLPKDNVPAVVLVNNSNLDIMMFGGKCHDEMDVLMHAIESNEFDPLANHGGTAAMRVMVTPKKPVSIVSIGPRYCVLRMMPSSKVSPPYRQLKRVKDSIIGFLHVAPPQIILERRKHDFYLIIRDEGCARSTFRLMTDIRRKVFNPLSALEGT